MARAWLAALIVTWAVASWASTQPARREVQGLRRQPVERATVNLAEEALREQEQAPGRAPLPRVIPLVAPSGEPDLCRGSSTGGAEPPVPGPKPPGQPATECSVPPPPQGFEALDDANLVIPPGTHGAVGPEHLLVTLNDRIRVQSIDGSALSTVTLGFLWRMLGLPEAFAPGMCTWL